jgi:hypothetical protein
MKERNSHYALVARRGELMAELFLQDLEPLSVARPPHDFGYDFLVVFKNSKGGMNTFGVEVKATEKPVPSRFVIDKQTYGYLVNSTIPGLLLVADVKRNKLFYAWPPQLDAGHNGSRSIDVPLVQIDSETRAELHKRLVAWPSIRSEEFKSPWSDYTPKEGDRVSADGKSGPFTVHKVNAEKAVADLKLIGKRHIAKSVPFAHIHPLSDEAE